ncbi:MAG: hypothetical protein JGK17_04355 [Microcoleus sp. PH2017_10_PVI_O_A]|uniref:hypothetical protein n=1 Tax=unclassified Microcoleus TaxID=2642155 RepID=UPI001D96AE23|nr:MULTISPECIES: hypothetical protein [unclassified Microcoleus]TAF38940.1 MAG: hypothetical protein EAZ69_02655 [Oscillatoriales cyanobacterium]MCC3404819.1 hypothetical protein [Microcoleus sp. PH2017_10_PVI_O_A]MCC3458925.1 hypothetical protein [Microcoleus sp. PH2017_11_PCY_U_A]MCC3477126.1 hypothetical protein [Microcoleus sp. PH2017_12_PCY_D_A]MCC3558321.1 hypothetical protein [Microcoleus sp. PH2017_27_LUM_O_A]
MKYKTLSFLVVALFTVTASMAARVNATSQDVQKPNLPSVQAQANASQPIPVALPIKAKIEMKGGGIRDGRVVQIDEKGQKLWIQGETEKRSLPLSQIEKIVFTKGAVVYRTNGVQFIRGEIPPATSTQAKWNGIPISAFELKDAAQGQAVVKLGPPVVSRGQLRGILGVAKDRQFVVDEMQFDVQKKTMTIAATPY